MRQPFTGRHMLSVLVTGFGIVVAVNLLMASLATSGFGGVIVTNSYVASQKFNGWIAEADRQRALGWRADMTRAEDGRLLVVTTGVPELGPERVDARAFLRRPLGEMDSTELKLVGDGRGTFASTEEIPAGRWIVRLRIEAAGQTWKEERELP